MGIFTALFKQPKCFVSGNGDSRPIEVSSKSDTIGKHFPTLKISQDGEDAQIFHLGSNNWSETTLPYAVMYGADWPAELLKMPHVKEIIDQASGLGQVPVSELLTGVGEYALKIFERKPGLAENTEREPTSPPSLKRAG